MGKVTDMPIGYGSILSECLTHEATVPIADLHKFVGGETRELLAEVMSNTQDASEKWSDLRVESEEWRLAYFAARRVGVSHKRLMDALHSCLKL